MHTLNRYFVHKENYKSRQENNNHKMVLNLAIHYIKIYPYWPYGEELTSSTYNEDSYRYTGHERDYKYKIGRFQTPDPVNGKTGMPLSFNLYSYVQNNPLNYIDPEGTMAKLQGLGKAVDPYPLNYSFPLTVGYISPAELSFYFSIVLSIALEVENENYKIQYVKVNENFMDFLKNQIILKGPIYELLVIVLKESGMGMLDREKLYLIYERIINDEKFYGLQKIAEVWGHEIRNISLKNIILEGFPIALTHAHPRYSASGKLIEPKPSSPDIKTASQLNLPHIVVSAGAIWLAMPNKQIYEIISKEFWWK